MVAISISSPTFDVNGTLKKSKSFELSPVRPSLLSNIRTIPHQNLPFELLQLTSPVSLRNRPKSVTLMGVHEYYPAVGVHDVQFEVSQEKAAGILTETHKSKGLQSSVSFPGVAPGVGLLSPVFGMDQQDTVVMSTQNSQTVDRLQNLSYKSLDQLEGGDRIAITKKASLNLGLYASTSSSVPGLATPELFAKTIINSVLLPCILLAVNAGAAVDTFNTQVLEIEKKSDQQFGLNMSQEKMQVSDMRSGCRTICWLMWLASAAVEFKNFMKPSDSAEELQALKQAPELWKNMAAAISYGQVIKSSQKDSVEFTVDARSSAGQSELESAIKTIHLGSQTILTTPLTVKAREVDVKQEQIQQGVDVQILKALKAAFTKTQSLVQETVHERDGSSQVTSTRKESHARQLEIFNKLQYLRSIYKTQVNIERQDNLVQKASVQTAQLGWTEKYSFKLQENNMAPATMISDCQFVQGYPGFARVSGSFENMENFAFNNSDVNVDVELNVEFEAKSLIKSLELLNKSQELMPMLYKSLLQLGVEELVGQSNRIDKNNFDGSIFEKPVELVRNFAMKDVAHMVETLFKVAKQDDTALEKEFIKILKRVDGKAKLKALTAIIAPLMKATSAEPTPLTLKLYCNVLAN